MNETALYYTFSTIAQTLAAAFGVLAVFVVLRLPAAEAVFAAAREAFKGRTDKISHEVLLHAAQRGGWDAVQQHLKEVGHGLDESWRRALEDLCDAVQEGWSLRQTTLTWLRRSLVPTLLTIAGCFGVLPFVPALSCHRGWAAVSVAGVLGLSLLCLALYGRLILTLVDPATRKAKPT